VIGLAGLIGVAALLLMALAVRPLPVDQLRSVLRVRPRDTELNATIEIGLQSDRFVTLADVPGPLLLILCLHEDDQFFCHRGFNYPEILRRLWRFIRYGERGSGSSITQQLAKNIITQRYGGLVTTFMVRKLREVIWTVGLEKHFSKEEILGLYLSVIRLGPDRPYGLKEACSFYFGNTPDALTPEQCFFLVGLIPRPVKRTLRILKWKEAHRFDYVTAYHKYSDLYRLLIHYFGWGGLSVLRSLGTDDAVEMLIRMSRYQPQPLASAYETALWTRVALSVDALFRVVQGLSLRGTELWQEGNRDVTTRNASLVNEAK
jgi:hypothetical protein